MYWILIGTLSFFSFKLLLRLLEMQNALHAPVFFIVFLGIQSKKIFYNSIVDALSNLKLQSNILNKWFKDSYIKASPGKYHLHLSATEGTNTLNIDVCINSSKCEKLLGVNIDSNLTFETHVKFLWKKASQKLNALLPVTWSLNFDQSKLLLNEFVTSRFSHAPVVWMKIEQQY